jgi:hypothetical protein
LQCKGLRGGRRGRTEKCRTLRPSASTSATSPFKDDARLVRDPGSPVVVGCGFAALHCNSGNFSQTGMKFSLNAEDSARRSRNGSECARPRAQQRREPGGVEQSRASSQASLAAAGTAAPRDFIAASEEFQLLQCEGPRGGRRVTTEKCQTSRPSGGTSVTSAFKNDGRLARNPGSPVVVGCRLAALRPLRLKVDAELAGDPGSPFASAGIKREGHADLRQRQGEEALARCPAANPGPVIPCATRESTDGCPAVD